LNVGSGKTLAVAGTLTVTGSATVEFADGSAASPSITNDGDTNTGIFFPAADTIAFSEGGVESMRIDSSGNLGLGVTPSAWYTSFGTKAFQFAASGSLQGLDVSSGDRRVALANNDYINSGGNDIYINTGHATKFQQRQGQFEWFTAASGTAGNAITFTQAMTLDASGNLGVGTTSPSQRIHASASDPRALLASTGTGHSAWQCQNTSGSSYFGRDNAGGSFFGTANATVVYSSSSDPITFYTSATERARIDSSGNLLVGTTTSDARVRVSGGGTVGRFVADGGSYTGNVISADTSGTAAGTGFNLILLQAGGANQFRVRGDGTIYAQNTTVQSISDRRIKENIVDAQDGLNVVTNLRPVRFDFKEKFGNNRKNQLGFIAQEIEQVFPEAVDIWGESDDPANPYKSVGSGALIPVLVKAMQEQQALITTLTARITALESA
jgi:hypothetical protein